MSTSYEILRFSKPSKKDLKNIRIFSEYERYCVNKDGEEDEDVDEYIRIFRCDDKSVANIANSRFATPLDLIKLETDYQKLYTHLGFSEEEIKEKKVYLCYGDGRSYFYNNGTERKRIGIEEEKKFCYEVPVKCFAVKMEALWRGEEVYFYPDRDRIRKYIPEIDIFAYVPVNNSLLAKAEIPFLIFEKNRGRCFLEEN